MTFVFNNPIFFMSMLVAGILFVTGLAAVFRKNMMVLVMGSFMMFNACVLLFAAFGRYLAYKADGEVMAFVLLGFGQCAAMIGMAVVARNRKYRKTVNMDEVEEMKH